MNLKVKKILYIVISLSFLLCQQVELLSDLILRNGILYDPSFQKPYTGKAIVLHTAFYQSQSKLKLDCKQTQYWGKDGWANSSKNCNFSFSTSSSSHARRALCENNEYIIINDKEGNIYDYDGDGVTSGDEVCDYGNGVKIKGISQEIHIVNGKKNGIFIEFTPSYNNAIRLQGFYYNSHRDSTWRYFQDTKLTSEEHWSIGLRHGKWTSYYGNGNVEKIEHYQNDKKNGEWTWYDEDGNVEKIENYQNDQKNGEWTSYYKNENKKWTGYYKDDQKNGIWTYYDIKGNLKEEENYHDDNLSMEATSYYEDGKIRMESTWYDGIRDLVIEYHPNGKKNYESRMEINETIMYSYYKLGELLSILTYNCYIDDCGKIDRTDYVNKLLKEGTLQTIYCKSGEIIDQWERLGRNRKYHVNGHINDCK